MKLVLFDCDGTLVDSGLLIHQVMSETFGHFGLPAPEYSRTKSVIGLTLDTAIARILGQEEIDERITEMALHYKQTFAPVRARPGFAEPLFDGIREVIDTLAAQEAILMGAVTGKSRRGLEAIAEAHGFSRHFFVSRTADECPSKPHPAMVLECCGESGVDPSRTVVIGDSVYDILMAKSAGARAVAVSWGYGDIDEMKAAGADAIVHKPADILHWI
jgi:phosphoglycolate phosphatase